MFNNLFEILNNWLLSLISRQKPSTLTTVETTAVTDVLPVLENTAVTIVTTKITTTPTK